jgi:hypothetical protein
MVKSRGRDRLPPQMSEVVEKTRQPFVQAITDVITAANSFIGGKVVLVITPTSSFMVEKVVLVGAAWGWVQALYGGINESGGVRCVDVGGVIGRENGA